MFSQNKDGFIKDNTELSSIKDDTWKVEEMEGKFYIIKSLSSNAFYCAGEESSKQTQYSGGKDGDPKQDQPRMMQMSVAEGKGCKFINVSSREYFLHTERCRPYRSYKYIPFTYYQSLRYSYNMYTFMNRSNRNLFRVFPT